MKHTACWISVLFLAALASSAALAGTAGAPVPDPLWAKAVAIAEASQGWIPGVMMVQVEELDRKERVKHSREEWVRLWPEDGQVRSETTKVVEDGEEKPADDESSSAVQVSSGEEEGEDGEASQSMSMEDSPFQPDVQARVTARRNGETRSIDGRRCVGFTFSQGPAPDAEDDEAHTLRGTAWLEEGTGRPLEVTHAPDPLPDHVKEMTQTDRYSGDAPGGWHLAESRIRITAGFLLLKMRMRMRMTFQDHWKMPEEAEPHE